MSIILNAQLQDMPDGAVHITWQLDTPAAVSIYQREFDSNEEELVADTMALDLTLSPPLHKRYVYRLRCQQQSVELHQRRLYLDGAPNFRDFGGYVSEFGGEVKRGMLFRSGRLAHLSEEAMAFVHSQGVRHVFDLRQTKEVEHDPTILPKGSDITLNNIPIAPGKNIGLMEMLSSQTLTAEQSESAMMSVFEDFALNQGDTFSQVLKQLVQSPEAVLVHCSAGKDRTGATVALVLRLLGVSRVDIIEDYMLTAEYYPSSPEEYDHVQQSLGALANKPEDIAPLMTVMPQFIRHFFETIDRHYSSEDEYFQSVYGIGASEREAIRANWLVSGK